MSLENEKTFTLTISHNKLFDILMRVAMREDIARLDAKNDSCIARLEQRIEELEKKMEAQF
jgi:cob(I)alamin adenosyltransferase